MCRIFRNLLRSGLTWLNQFGSSRNIHIRLENNPTAENLIQTTFFGRHLVFIQGPDELDERRVCSWREGIGLFFRDRITLPQAVRTMRAHGAYARNRYALSYAPHTYREEPTSSNCWSFMARIDHTTRQGIYCDEGVCLDRWRSPETVLSFVLSACKASTHRLIARSWK